jgi:uncharacterized delta-60 repeat protein
MKKLYVLFLLFSLKIISQVPTIDNSFNVKETGRYQQNIGKGGVVLPNNKILSVFQKDVFEYHVLLLNPDGSIDTNFNSSDSFSNKEIQIYAKSDGSFLTLTYDFKLKSFNADGTINANFTTPTITSNSVYGLMITDILYQEDGKISLIGRFDSVNDIFYKNCVRLNSDGSIDTTFILDYESSFDTITIQSDGKYLISGNFFTRLARFNSNGKLDTTFKVNTTIDPQQKFVTNGFETSDNSRINDVIVQPDGKIIAVGSNFVANSQTVSYYIVRLNSDGTLDSSLKSLDSRSSNVVNVYLQKDNKIILNLDSNTLIRLNNDGTIDDSFKYLNTLSLINEGELYFQGSKIIISANFKDSKGITREGVHRLNTDGSIDLTFNPHSGLNILFNHGQYEYKSKVLLDQKVLLVGDFSSYNDNGFRNMCRITENGEFDPTFKLDPLVKIYAESSQNDYIILQQNDGKILLVHTDALDVNNNRKSIIRLNIDGSIDNSFNCNLSGGYIYDFKILNNGKFLVVGYLGEFINTDNDGYKSYNLIQLNSDGSIDPSINTTFRHQPMLITVLSNNKTLISFEEVSSNYFWKYYPVMKLNEDGSEDSSFKSGYYPYSKVKELSDGKLLVTYYNPNQAIFGEVFYDTFLTRVNSDGSPDPSFTTYTFDGRKVWYSSLYENGQINLFLSYNSTNTTNRLKFNSEGTLLNTSIYNSSSDFGIQNCDDLLFYGYFKNIEDLNKNGIVRYKSSDFDSNASPTGEFYQSFTIGQTLENLKVTGSNIKWYNTQSNCDINSKLTKKRNSTIETILPASTLLVDGMTYYASQTINDIESSHRLAVTVYYSTLGLKNNDLPNLAAYPNPIQDHYTISNNEEINKVEVYNSLGQLEINNKYNKNSVQIDFSLLNSGLYFVKIYSNNKTATIKTIKK